EAGAVPQAEGRLLFPFRTLDRGHDLHLRDHYRAERDRLPRAKGMRDLDSDPSDAQLGNGRMDAAVAAHAAVRKGEHAAGFCPRKHLQTAAAAQGELDRLLRDVHGWAQLRGGWRSNEA